MSEQPYSLGHYVAKLLRLRWMLFSGSIRHAKTGRKIAYAFALLGLLAVLAGVLAVSWLFLRFMNSPELAQVVDLGPFLTHIPALVFTGAFVGLLLTSFGTLLQVLYLSGDLEFLLSAPLPARAVFVTKLLQAILPTLGFIGLFAVPLLFGLGATLGYNALYYPLVVVLLIAVALAAAGIAALLVMGIVRIFPARRVGEVLLLFTTLFFTLFGQLGNRFSSVTAEQTVQALATASRFTPAWSPLSWPGEGLTALGEGRWLAALGLLGLSLALSGVIFFTALATAEKLYFAGWASVRVGTQHRRPRREAQRAEGATRGLPAALLGLLPAQIRGIVVKDLLVLRRDLRNLTQIFSSLIFGVIYLVLSITEGREDLSASPDLSPELASSGALIMTFLGIGIALFVGWSLLSRLAMMGFSQEGPHYWVLKAAPVGSGRLLFAKFLVAYLPTLALSVLFLIAAALFRGMSLGVFAFGLAVVALSLAGGAGINLAFGVLGVNLDWNNPQQMVRGTIGCLGSLSGMLYMGLSVAVFLGPPILFVLLGQSALPGYLVGLAVGGALSLTCALAPLLAVSGRVARIGEG